MAATGVAPCGRRSGAISVDWMLALITVWSSLGTSGLALSKPTETSRPEAAVSLRAPLLTRRSLLSGQPRYRKPRLSA
jgi:hypothetical protein